MVEWRVWLSLRGHSIYMRVLVSPDLCIVQVEKTNKSKKNCFPDVVFLLRDGEMRMVGCEWLLQWRCI